MNHTPSLASSIDRSGFILYVRAYEACVEFYGEVLGLPLMFRTDELSCFAFGGAYLMVELDDTYYLEGGQDERTRSCLRMNVVDVKEWADRVAGAGVAVDYQEHSWGTVAKFRDPDGNLCAFKDSAGFEAQVKGGK